MAYYSFIGECTVSSGADRSERSVDKKGEKNFWNNKILRTTAFGLFFKIIQNFLEYRSSLPAHSSLLEKRRVLNSVG